MCSPSPLNETPGSLVLFPFKDNLLFPFLFMFQIVELSGGKSELQALPAVARVSFRLSRWWQE